MSTASKHDNSYVSQKGLNFLVSYKNGLASNIENKNAQFNESETWAWNDKHEMKQKAINRMSHMTSAHLYFIFNIHNPYMGEPKISCIHSQSKNNVSI